MIPKIMVGTGAKAMLKRRTVLKAASALTWLTAAGVPALAAPAPDAARDLIQTVGTEVLDILKQEVSQDEKFEQLVTLLDEAIDLDLVARLILARHWRAADEASKDRLSSPTYAARHLSLLSPRLVSPSLCATAGRFTVSLRERGRLR